MKFLHGQDGIISIKLIGVQVIQMAQLYHVNIRMRVYTTKTAYSTYIMIFGSNSFTGTIVGYVDSN